MPINKIDPGRIETDRLLAEIEYEVRKVYRQAAKEVGDKVRDYFKRFKKKDDTKRDQLKSGVITQQEYNEWRKGQLLVGQRWIDMREQLAADMANADRIAYSIVNGCMPEAYAVSHNYATFEVESGSLIDTSYTLYNREAVERLLLKNPDMLPAANPKRIYVERVANYNKKLQSSVMQGILQGESIPEIANRIQDSTYANHRKAIMYARTAMTGAENAGHEDAYKRAVGKGIKMRQTWLATLDGRTRHEHRILDGETVDVGQKFSNGLEFPGDPKGEPSQVYNCRCRTIASFPDQDFSSFPRNSRLGSMSYSDWKNAKGDEPLFKATRNVNDDFKQQEQYRKLLGSKKIPYDIRDFQKIKYEQPDEWKKLKAEAAKKRSERRKKGK